MRIAYRFVATIVALGLFATSAPTVAAAAQPDDVETLYAEGDSAFANGDYLGAARAWGKALDLMEENDDTNSTRAQILVSALSAYMEAFVETRKVDHLRAAARLLERYAQSLESAYDGEARLSEAVIEMKRRLENALESAEEEDEPDDEASGDEADSAAAAPSPSEPTDAGPPSSSGKGLVVAGIVTSALGLGAGTFMTISLVQSYQLNEEFRTEDDALQKQENVTQDEWDELAKLHDDGEAANGRAIIGAIATPILLGAGIALLVVGARRSRSNLAVVPAIAPGYAGVGLSARF
ncbi:MAG: hypothetical protein B7733_13255 [Myxococcales bacterium FL481]|nr:MAG: hypothetical protein B7733_13255 [Myxococcales bacterium FL481]